MASAEQVFDALFSQQRVSYELINVLVRQGSGMLANLGDDGRKTIGTVAGALTVRMKLRVATPERMRDAVLSRRPDLKPILDSDAGLAWLAGELEELKALAGVRA